MKKVIIALSVISILLMFSIGFYFNNTVKASEGFERGYITYEYVITSIDSEGYYGKSETDNTGIFFVSENIETGEEIRVGDKVKVYFDINNRVDGLLKVEVMEWYLESQ